MRKHEKNRYAMYNGVIAHLEKNSSIYSENEEFVNHRDTFKTATEEIGLKEDVRSKATTGKTLEKRVTRESVTIQALGFAGALCAYARKAKNITLAESTKLSKTKLDAFRDDVLVIELNSIKENAVNYRAALEKYDIPPAKLENFVNNIAQYSKALGAKSTGGTLKTGAVKSLTTLFKEAGIVLDSIDRLMENYRDTNKEFYDSYKAARVIKNLGIRHEEPKTPVTQLKSKPLAAEEEQVENQEENKIDKTDDPVKK